MSSELANHLWQSSVFAIAAGLLAFALRKNLARVRYWVWFSASAKFLVPFSVIVALGSYFAPRRTVPIAQPAVLMVKEIGQPFVAPVTSFSVVHSSSNSLAALGFVIWLCGFLAMMASWWMKWRKIRIAVRAGRPVNLQAGVPVLASRMLLEPGVFGIFRSVVLLPEGITDHLTSEQLEAILAHELCHVRRRDNLVAAIHMLVQAIFWFHPLVWWIGARLVEERERACDEEVLRRGSKPQVYAESILRTCEFYLESPLACMSGVTGADLRKRIVRIMTQRVINKLDPASKLLLASFGAAVIAGPLAFGLMNAPQSQPLEASQKKLAFEVASVKPDKSGDQGMWIRDSHGRFSAHGITLIVLIQNAYDVRRFQITGGPSWINSEKFDIEAKAGDAEPDAGALTEDERQAYRKRQALRLQSLLEERFQFRFHTITKEMPVYALVLNKGDAKIQASKDPASKPMIQMRPGQLTARGITMPLLAANLSNLVSRVVLDRTGLTGAYDITLTWTPDRSESSPFGEEPKEMAPPDTLGPSIFTAVQEQLGLKLKPDKGPVAILVIDHVEHPSEN